MAKKIKGIVLEIGSDTSKFTKNFKEAEETAKGFSDEVKQIDKALKFDPKNIDLLKQKEDALSDAFEAQKKKLQALKDAQVDADKAFKDGKINATEYRTFQRELIETERRVKEYGKEIDDTKAKTRAAEKEQKSLTHKFGQFKDKVRETASKVPILNKVIKKSGDELDRTGKEAGKAHKAMSGLASVAKTAGKVIAAGMAAIGTGIATAAVGIAKGVKSAAELGDKIGDEAQKLRMTTDEYQELSYAAEICGTNMNVIKKAQKNLAAEHPELSMTDALKMCADSADVAGKATELFGAKAAQELLPMLNEGSAGIDEMTKKAHEMGMVMGEDAINAANNFEDTLAGLKHTFTSITSTLLSELLPGLTSVMEGLQGLLLGSDDAKEKIKSGADEMIGALNDMLPQFLEIFSGIFSVLLEIAPEIIGQFITTLIGLLPDVIASLQEILQTLVNVLRENAPLITQSAIDLLIMLANFVIENAPLLIQAALTIIQELANSLAPNLPTILLALTDCLLLIVDMLLDNMDMLIDAVLKIIVAIGTALPTMFQKILNKLPSLAVKLVAAILRAIPKLLSAVGKIFSSIGSSISNSWGKFKTAISGVLTKAVNAVKGKVNSFLNAGKDLIRGLVSGIENMGQWVWSKIKSFCSGIVDKVKGFFGIASPSKVFAQIGRYLAQGLGIGFKSEMDGISQDMINSVPTDFQNSYRLLPGSAGAAEYSIYGGITADELQTVLEYVLGRGVNVQANGKNLGRLIKNVVKV